MFIWELSSDNTWNWRPDYINEPDECSFDMAWVNASKYNEFYGMTF
jgi:hypothetical protein